MQNILKNAPGGNQSVGPWILLIILTGYVIAFLFLFQIAAYIAAVPFFEFSFEKMIKVLKNPYYDNTAKMPLMLIQATTAIGAFILAPWFFIRKNLKLDFSTFFNLPKPIIYPIGMTTVLLFCFMVSNSILIEWNQNFIFPEALSGLESWMQDTEQRMERLTNYLTNFDSVWQYLVALVVIAVIPAVGEELLFRGLIQNLFNAALKNAHLAIWVSAFIFSAFHMQFYGVLPRMMLGVLFGYLYYWSGSLSLAMIGHFINNAFSLTIFYMSKNGFIDISPDDLEKSPSIYVILLFLGIGLPLLFMFRKYFLATDE
jgi:uncharacterized protein